MSALADNWVMIGRQYRLLIRQPIWIFIMLVQPMIWLLLYSQLFGKLPRLGGFGTASYIEYLTPGDRRDDVVLRRHVVGDDDRERARARRLRALPRDAALVELARRLAGRARGADRGRERA